MGINIHIDDVINEHPQALIDIATFLQVVANRKMAPTEQAERPGSVQVFVPPVSAPITPPAPPAPPATDSALDARGFPWDPRIHSDKKTKNGDGTWRYRRGVKEDVIGPVEEELRGVMGLKEAEPVFEPPISQQVHHTAHSTVDPSTAIPPAPAASDVPPPPAPVAPLVGSSEGSPTEGDFHSLTAIATKALATKTITQEQITGILNAVGAENGCELPHLGALFHRADLIEAVRTRLQAAIGGGV